MTHQYIASVLPKFFDIVVLQPTNTKSRLILRSLPIPSAAAINHTPLKYPANMNQHCSSRHVMRGNGP